MYCLAGRSASYLLRDLVLGNCKSGINSRTFRTFGNINLWWTKSRSPSIAYGLPISISPQIYPFEIAYHDGSKRTNKNHLGLQPIISSRTLSNESASVLRAPKTVPDVFVDCMPCKVQPFLRLSRVHRPIGNWLLFWPCTWGLTVGCGGIPDASLLALFGLGAFMMRGAGCTINDMWDRNIDTKVERTKDRPIASGEVKMFPALVWLATQLSVSLGVVLQLNPACFSLSVGALGLVVLYPLAKRFINWPQGVLGLTFNTGVLMGYTAALHSAAAPYLSTPWITPVCLSLYSSGILWTLIYDTIYAHQDRRDDAILGLGSTARIFGENTKTWLTGFSASMTSFLAIAGYLGEFSWPYYVGIGSVAAHLAWQIRTLDINNGKNCGDRFRKNSQIGWMIFLSLLASYWWQSNPGIVNHNIVTKSVSVSCESQKKSNLCDT